MKKKVRKPQYRPKEEFLERGNKAILVFMHNKKFALCNNRKKDWAHSEVHKISKKTTMHEWQRCIFCVWYRIIFMTVVVSSLI